MCITEKLAVSGWWLEVKSESGLSSLDHFLFSWVRRSFDRPEASVRSEIDLAAFFQTPRGAFLITVNS